MSDHWPLSLTIYATNNPAAVLDVIDEYSLTEGADNTELILGDSYEDSETTTLADEVANALIEKAPGTSFWVNTSPAYEWMGDAVIYMPDLGRYDFTCDAYAEPQFTRQEVLAMLTLDKPELERALGTPWFDRVRELTRGIAA